MFGRWWKIDVWQVIKKFRFFCIPPFSSSFFPSFTFYSLLIFTTPSQAHTDSAQKKTINLQRVWMLIWDRPTVLQSWIFLHFVFFQFKILSFLQILLFCRESALVLSSRLWWNTLWSTMPSEPRGQGNENWARCWKWLLLFFHHVAKLFACRWVFF